MIGVFDSGLGGLTVLQAFLDRLPGYSYTYLGDNKRAPYGDKEVNEIYNYTKEGIDFLYKQGCSLIIVACNTISAVALRKIQTEYLPGHYPPAFRVLGVIRPVVETIGALIKTEPSHDNFTEPYIGIIGTRATIKSGAYETELNKLGLNINIVSRACPRLVPMIESGQAGQDPAAIDGELRQCLRGLEEADYLILGCTHYSIIEKQIKKHLAKTRVLAAPLSVAGKLEDYISRHDEIKLDTKGQRGLYITGNLAKTSANLLSYFNDFKHIEIKAIKSLY